MLLTSIWSLEVFSCGSSTVMGGWNTLTAYKGVRTVLRYPVICSTAAASCPSTAMMRPLVSKAGEAGLEFASGGEILERIRILLTVLMDMTMASTDLACVESPDTDALWRGARVREESGGCASGYGRGGGPMANVGEFMKSGRGSDSRRRGKAYGVAGPLWIRGAPA